MNQPRILIIDDEETICDACSQVFRHDGYLVETSFEGVGGLKKVDEFKPDLVFVDLKMPGISGIEVLERIKEKDKEIVPIVITGYATIESAVESMKHGAFDFLPKPFTPDELLIITKRALEKRRIALEAEVLRREKENMRQNFVSMVSHEMRTPLAAVIQYLEVLTKGFAGSVSAEQSKIINRMKIRLNELLALIDRWLKLARIEDLKIKENFTDFAVVPLVNESVELVRPLAQEKNVEIGIKVPKEEVLVFGDPGMIKEVFANLIHNGIKYNQKGGKVNIEVRPDKEAWVVDFSDTGAGIPANEVEHLGNEFYRVRREGGAVGTGLGLAIVKKILDIHGGRLEIKSELNKGSTFSVYLPRGSRR